MTDKSVKFIRKQLKGRYLPRGYIVLYLISSPFISACNRHLKLETCTLVCRFTHLAAVFCFLCLPFRFFSLSLQMKQHCSEGGMNVGQDFNGFNEYGKRNRTKQWRDYHLSIGRW